MFIKPYRIPTHSNSVQNRHNWLRHDIAASSDKFFESLNNHFISHGNTLGPVINKGTSVSFQYAGQNDYIIRDVGFATFIIKSLIDNKIPEGFNQKVDNILNHIVALDKYLTGNRKKEEEFISLPNRRLYTKSIVIGVNPETDSVLDIEYVDVFFDSEPDLVTDGFKESFVKNPEYKSRLGISIRINLKNSKSNYRVNKETVTAVLCSDDGWSNSSVSDSRDNAFYHYLVDSSEFYYETSIHGLDGLTTYYLNAHLDLLRERLGYSIDTVNKDILTVVNMQLI